MSENYKLTIMKELSIEEKAKRYELALERCRKLYNEAKANEYNSDIEDYETIFPELAESEDERIRKAILNYMTIMWGNSQDDVCGVHVEDAIAWLEKQGEQKVPVNDFKAKDWYVSKVDGKIHNLYYNPTDKVEPKFHEGDWLCANTPNDYAHLVKIIKVVDVFGKERYKVSRDYDSDLDVVECDFIEKNYHLWTIQDAKDGDVLASELCDSIILFKGINDDNNIDFYCDHDFSEIDLPGDRFSVNNGQHYGNVEDSKDFHPATKEQRDALEKAMADAGYTFDFEKKELKKVVDEEQIKKNLQDNSFRRMFEQKPAWSKEDEYRTEKLLGWINTLINYIHEDAMVSLDLRMERIQQVEQIKIWLKSLRPQNAWKPSEQQMASITCAVRKMKESACYDSELVSLLNDLKKLKGE